MWHLSTTNCRQYSQVSQVYFPTHNTIRLWSCQMEFEHFNFNVCISLFRSRQIMEKGASQSWQEILQEVTGEGRLDGTALREFFAPLEEWLRQENLRNNEFVGWNYDGDYCKHRSVRKKSQRMQPPVFIDSFYDFNFFLLSCFLGIGTQHWHS